MSVSHAPVTTVTSENRDEKKVPGLLEMLAQVPDLRKRRGRRYELVFVLAVAACCALAGAKTYREIGDQAADLPQDVLARLGGRIHPLKRAIIAPSEKRIRTLIQAIDAERLDQIIGGWLRALAQAGKLEPLLTAIAIDGKWLRGIADGTEKLFAAMLQEEKVIIGQHRIPAGTNEITQVKDLLDAIDLVNCVVTADAAPRPARHRGIHRGEERRRGAGRSLRRDRERQPACPPAGHPRQDHQGPRRRARLR
jgi:DDE_Tnp_1-associated/Transposase DDE domain